MDILIYTIRGVGMDKSTIAERISNVARQDEDPPLAAALEMYQNAHRPYFVQRSRTTAAGEVVFTVVFTPDRKDQKISDDRCEVVSEHKDMGDGEGEKDAQAKSMELNQREAMNAAICAYLVMRGQHDAEPTQATE